MLNALEYLFPFKILTWKGTWFHIAKWRCIFPLQILQCLTIQGLTSSGGGSSVGGDGGNSSGVSRALVKDWLILSKIFIGVFQVINVTKMFWPGGISQVQDVQYAIWGTSSKAISVDSSWHWVAIVCKACGCGSVVACLQIFCKTFWVPFLILEATHTRLHTHTSMGLCMCACKRCFFQDVFIIKSIMRWGLFRNFQTAVMDKWNTWMLSFFTFFKWSHLKC